MDGLRAFTLIIFPDKAYSAQRTWMTLIVRKPLEMTIRSFMYRIEQINEYLPHFPGAPGQPAVKLNEMELIELLFRAIPRKWQLRLKDKGIKRHQISRTEYVAEIETVQAVEMQQKLLDKKGQKTKPELSHRDKKLQAGAAAKKRKTNKHKQRNNKKIGFVARHAAQR